jgi:protein-S-isoprenylcysteine O-methyltransferase Ste14
VSEARLAALLLLRTALLALVLGGLLFGSAASWRYWQAWAYLGVFLGSSMAIGVYFLVRDPAFLERRMRWRETERSQKIGQSAMALLSIIAYVVPGLDHRYGWSQVPVALLLVADGGVLAGFLFVLRVFRENRYAASTVGVEAGQPVVSSGPYAVVRHPMYLGVLLILLWTPVALGSYWALPAFLLFSVGLALRIRDEESVLLRGLPGYREYCLKVRWRLIPGLW